MGTWHVAKAGSETWSGPFTEEEILAHLESGQLSWADGAWNPGFGAQWKRLYDVAELRAKLPALPSPELIRKLLDSPDVSRAVSGAEAMERAIWYIQYDGSEFGPMTSSEVQAIVLRGKLVTPLLAWRTGFSKWLPITEIPELTPLIGGTGALADGDVTPVGLRLRHADRKAFMATVRFSSIRAGGERSSQVYTGLARDISASGMRVTTNQVPKTLGMGLLVHVQPSLDAVPEFKTEAEVARIVGDRVFAVRFRSLDGHVLQSILNFTSRQET